MVLGRKRVDGRSFRGYTENKIMKRTTTKKTDPRGKSRKDKENPSEFNRDWQELEVQHDRLKSDWGSLAALMGIGSKREPA